MKITVLGGAGRLGEWITKMLVNEGFEVSISTPNPDKYKKIIERLKVKVFSDNKEAVKFSDIIIVSVPVEKTVNVLNEILPYVKDGSIIVEVASIKKPILNFIKNNEEIITSKKIKLLSVHPMFGPGAESLNNQNVVLIESKYAGNLISKTKEFIEKRKGNTVICSYIQHDKMIAYTLNLPHFLLILFTSVLKTSPGIELLKKYGGSTFKTLTLIAESLLNESVDLYSHIQIDNKQFKDLLEKLKTNFEELYTIIKKEDVNKFKIFWDKYISSLKSKSDYRDSYRKIYDLLKKV
ncbi:MAG: prephenate dehydrogenase/arogenate dehydrogenase family protein [Candidatus Odinarchaeia archaeon]